MFYTISVVYIHLGTDGEKIPNYEGYGCSEKEDDKKR